LWRASHLIACVSLPPRTQGEAGFGKADEEYKNAEVERQKAAAERQKAAADRIKRDEERINEEEKELLAKKQARAHTGRATPLPRTWLLCVHPSVSSCTPQLHGRMYSAWACPSPVPYAARVRALQALKDKKAKMLAKAEEKEESRKELASMLYNSEVRARSFHKSINYDQTKTLSGKVRDAPHDVALLILTRHHRYHTLQRHRRASLLAQLPLALTTTAVMFPPSGCAARVVGTDRRHLRQGRGRARRDVQQGRHRGCRPPEGRRRRRQGRRAQQGGCAQACRPPEQHSAHMRATALPRCLFSLARAHTRAAAQPTLCYLPPASR
jgi:G:T/U-mismatch repair DNA glycosylase